MQISLISSLFYFQLFVNAQAKSNSNITNIPFTTNNGVFASTTEYLPPPAPKDGTLDVRISNSTHAAILEKWNLPIQIYNETLELRSLMPPVIQAQLDANAPSINATFEPFRHVAEARALQKKYNISDAEFARFVTDADKNSTSTSIIPAESKRPWKATIGSDALNFLKAHKTDIMLVGIGSLLILFLAFFGPGAATTAYQAAEKAIKSHTKIEDVAAVGSNVLKFVMPKIKSIDGLISTGSQIIAHLGTIIMIAKLSKQAKFHWDFKNSVVQTKKCNAIPTPGTVNYFICPSFDMCPAESQLLNTATHYRVDERDPSGTLRYSHPLSPFKLFHKSTFTENKVLCAKTLHEGNFTTKNIVLPDSKDKVDHIELAYTPLGSFIDAPISVGTFRLSYDPMKKCAHLCSKNERCSAYEYWLAPDRQNWNCNLHEHHDITLEVSHPERKSTLVLFDAHGSDVGQLKATLGWAREDKPVYVKLS